jgi:hypothetical protein
MAVHNRHLIDHDAAGPQYPAVQRVTLLDLFQDHIVFFVRLTAQHRLVPLRVELSPPGFA